MTAAVRTAPLHRLASRPKWYRRIVRVLTPRMPRVRLRPRPRTTSSQVRVRPRERRGPPRLARRAG